MNLAKMKISCLNVLPVNMRQEIEITKVYIYVCIIFIIKKIIYYSRLLINLYTEGIYLLFALFLFFFIVIIIIFPSLWTNDHQTNST